MADDPLLALMSHFAAGAGAGKGAGSVPLPQPETRPKTLARKLLPILHVFSVWALVAFFIFWMEPEAFRAQNSAVVSSSTMWGRWARLATGSLEGSLWSVETVVSLVLFPAAPNHLSLTCNLALFLGFHFPGACPSLDANIFGLCERYSMLCHFSLNAFSRTLCSPQCSSHLPSLISQYRSLP